MPNDEAADSPARERVVSKLIAAARPLLARYGPARVSLRMIAAEAGVNYGLIHQYVGTKEALLALVLRRSSEDWARHFAESESTADAISYLMRPKNSEYARTVAHALLEGRDPGALLGHSPALGELTRRIAQELPGGHASEVDPRVQVAILTAVSLGWGLFGSFVQAIAGLDEIPPEQLTQQVYDVVRAGVVGTATG